VGQKSATAVATVLVVDDEQAITGVIEALLLKEGYKVLLAHDGQSGASLAAEIHPDIIILDITMPKLDGYATAELIRKTPGLESVPIIFLTGRTASEDGGRAFEAGGDSFVRKPFTGKQIIDLVKLTLLSTQ
jgi:DNA-binding response OmpR family regulator